MRAGSRRWVAVVAVAACGHAATPPTTATTATTAHDSAPPAAGTTAPSSPIASAPADPAAEDVAYPFDPFADLRLTRAIGGPLPRGVAVRFGNLASGTGTPEHLAISDDGARVAVCTTSYDIVLWDPATGLPTKILTTLAQDCQALAFSRDGKRLMVLDYEGLSTIDVASGSSARVSFADAGAGGFHATRLARGPRDQWLVAGCAEYARDSGLVLDGARVQLALGSLGRENELDSERCGTAIAMSPDGAWIAVASEHGTQVYRTSGEVVAHLPAYWAHALVFTPDSKQVLAASGRAINAFDLTTFDAVGSYGFLDNRFFTEAMALSRDGKTLFAISGGDLKAFDVASHRERWTGVAAIDASIATTPSGEVFAVSRAPQGLARWSAAGARLAPYDLARHDGAIESLAFFDDGRQIVSGGDGARVWRADGTPLATFARRPSGATTYARPRPGSSEIVTVTGTCALHAWDPAARTIRLATSLAGGVRCHAIGLAIAPDGATAAIADEGGALILVELAHGGVVARVTLGQPSTSAPFFTDDGARVWIGTGDEVVAVEVSRAAVVEHRALAHPLPEGLTVIPAANLIVYGHDTSVIAQALDTGAARWTAPITSDEFEVGAAIDLRARGEIAVGVRSDVVRFDAKTGAARGTLHGESTQSPARALALAPDGKRLLAAFPGEVIGWDL
ncbi:MAG: hypothetical protein K8W52_37345 [Deltaproteobacteria bacterium]|nr:hypothetical protein [Deltaproteobacteria bacterium]